MTVPYWAGSILPTLYLDAPKILQIKKIKSSYDQLANMKHSTKQILHTLGTLPAPWCFAPLTTHALHSIPHPPLPPMSPWVRQVNITYHGLPVYSQCIEGDQRL